MRLLLTPIVALACALSAGCADEATECSVTVSNVCGDSLVAELNLPTLDRIHHVSYSVTGDGLPEISGRINTAAPNAAASTWIAGLPDGEGFTVSMSAQNVAGQTACASSAVFDMPVAAETTPQDCTRPQPPLGSPTNACAVVDQAVVAPLQTSLGQVIDVSVKASDADGDPIRYRWAATAGDFYYWYEAVTRYDCDGTDATQITVEVSDDNFTHCIDRRTTTVACVD